MNDKPEVWRLCLDFRTAEDMFNWFKSAQDFGAFGFEEKVWDEELTTLEPCADIGIRQVDYIDDDKKLHRYKVSSLREAGSFLSLEDVEATTRVVHEIKGGS